MTQIKCLMLGLGLSLGFELPVAFGQNVSPLPEATADVAAHAAADYRSRARMPDWIQTISPGGVDPLMAKRTPTRQSLPREEGDQLSVWCSDIRYEAGNVVTLYAELDLTPLDDADLIERPGRKTRIDGVWTVTGVIAGRISGPVAEVTYRDDGLGRDERRGDGLYTASFTLPEDYKPAIGQAESLSVIVTATDANGDRLKAVGGLLYSNPAASLTGRFKEEMRDGDLILRAEIDVRAPGRFHLMGTLGDRRGEAIVTAQNALELKPGVQWMELDFYGLALSERKASGSLVLSSVSLSTTNGIPNALGPVIENAYRTSPYRARDFHSRPWNRPDLIEQAERLERIAAERDSRQR